MCRNPLYLGSFLLAASVALFLKSPTSLVAVVLAGVGYAAFTIPAEEQYLSRQFGDVYRAYCRQTPRFLPRPRAFRTSKVVQVHLGALHRECWKALGWIMVPVLTEVIAHLRIEPWWPRLLRLP